MQEVIVTDISQLESVVQDMLTMLQRNNSGKAAVVALHGQLGAGKTTFIQTLAKKLSIQEAVTSPTFVVMKQYSLHTSPYKNLIHIDAYRIEDVDEMRVLGFANLLKEKDTMICIEWAERIAELLPKHTLHISITVEGEKRKFSFRYD